jgi:hypothetical protein
VTRALQRGRAVFLPLTFEFFLRGFEGRYTRRDFLALAREPVVPFAHAHPLNLIRVPSSLASAIEARIGLSRRKIVIVEKDRRFFVNGAVVASSESANRRPDGQKSIWIR